MSDFIVRLIEEESQLDEKIGKLDAFIKSEKFKTVDAIQQSLLKVQIHAMVAYSQCLHQRLKGLTSASSSDGSNPPHGPGTPP